MLLSANWQRTASERGGCRVPVCVAGFRICRDHGQLCRSCGCLKRELLLLVRAAGNSPWCCLGTYLPTSLLRSQGRASRPWPSEETFRLCNAWLQLCARRAVRDGCGLSLQQAGELCWALEKSPWAFSSGRAPPASGVRSAGPWLRLWAGDGLW